MKTEPLKWDLLIQVGAKEAERRYDTWAQAANALSAILPKLLPAEEIAYVREQLIKGPERRSFWVACSAEPNYRFVITRELDDNPWKQDRPDRHHDPTIPNPNRPSLHGP